MKLRLIALATCLIATLAAITAIVSFAPPRDCTSFVNTTVKAHTTENACVTLGAPVPLGTNFGIEMICMDHMERHLYLNSATPGGKEMIDRTNVPHTFLGRCKATTGVVFDLYIFTYPIIEMKG